MKKILLFLLINIFLNNLFAQEETKKVELNGYLSNMQSVQFQDIHGEWINDNIIQNRINFNWYPTKHLTINAGLRTRLFTGESVKIIPNYGGLLKDSELGLWNMNYNVIEEQSVILNMNIDRLFLQFEKGNFSATIGRQRINWGNTFVWNPNDLFNTYSFFDFDYVERPGSDAIKLKYFTSEVSSIELAAKIDKNEDITSALLWKFNHWNYDFQLLGGILNSSDYAIGGGWSGAIKSFDFKGEITYLRPCKNISDTIGQLMGSLMMGYTFNNSLDLKFEFLYTEIPTNGISGFYQYYYSPLSVKTLSFTEYNLFLQAGYQITPLITGSLSGMYYPAIQGYFIGPSFDFSFTDNLYASVVVQTFSGEMKNPISLLKEREYATFGYLRLKWSF